jgi:hypothetical protein
LLDVAMVLARLRRTTAGKVVSDLMRKALAPAPSPRTRNGVPLFPADPSGRILTLSYVNAVRDEG